MATPSDLSQLLEMGFDKQRAELAVKKSGGIQGALQWLEDNQDKSVDDILAASAADAETDPSIEPAPLKEGEVAKSLKCDECGKKFRSVAQAEFHGGKTGHENFSESTEEIAPLTEEEKKQRLEELRAKMADKKSQQALVDKEEQKRNEKIRMKATKETQDAKEELAKQEQIKAAAKKRQEKLDDIAAKKRIQEKIAVDKEERRLRAEKAKANREGRDLPTVAAGAPTPPAVPRPAVNHTDARLRLQMESGTVIKTYPVDTTLFEVAQAIEEENGAPVTSFTMTYPKKTFSGGADLGMTLKEAGLAPSAVLIVK